jgi:hypothetical protein
MGIAMIITYQNTDNDFFDTPAITLCKILQVLNGGGTGGGGTQQVFFTTTATPTNAALPALRYPAAGGTLEQWSGAAWV